MSYFQLGGRANLPVNQIGTQLRKIKVVLAKPSRTQAKSKLNPPRA